MKSRADRIIIDTNLWISFLISKDHAQLDELILSQRCVLIFSEELLNEFLEVIKRPKFIRLFSLEDTLSLIKVIQRYAEFVEVKSHVKACRDLKDNFLLSLAKDATVDFLITGDKDLLSMKKYGKTKIVTISQYIEQKK